MEQFDAIISIQKSHKLRNENMTRNSNNCIDDDLQRNEIGMVYINPLFDRNNDNQQKGKRLKITKSVRNMLAWEAEKTKCTFKIKSKKMLISVLLVVLIIVLSISIIIIITIYASPNGKNNSLLIEKSPLLYVFIISQCALFGINVASKYQESVGLKMSKWKSFLPFVISISILSIFHASNIEPYYIEAASEAKIIHSVPLYTGDCHIIKSIPDGYEGFCMKEKVFPIAIFNPTHDNLTIQQSDFMYTTLYETINSFHEGLKNNVECSNFLKSALCDVMFPTCLPTCKPDHNCLLCNEFHNKCYKIDGGLPNLGRILELVHESMINSETNEYGLIKSLLGSSITSKVSAAEIEKYTDTFMHLMASAIKKLLIVVDDVINNPNDCKYHNMNYTAICNQLSTKNSIATSPNLKYGNCHYENLTVGFTEKKDIHQQVIPEYIIQLVEKQLIVLDLEKCKIKANLTYVFQKVCKKFPSKLNILHLSRNLIYGIIPEDFFVCNPKLEKLFLDGNRGIISLPQNISKKRMESMLCIKVNSIPNLQRIPTINYFYMKFGDLIIDKTVFQLTASEYCDGWKVENTILHDGPRNTTKCPKGGLKDSAGNYMEKHIMSCTEHYKYKTAIHCKGRKASVDVCDLRSYV